MTDGLSRTLLEDDACEITEAVQKVAKILTKEGPKWIWKYGKNGYEALLPNLTPDHLQEVIAQESPPGSRCFFQQYLVFSLL